MKVRVPDAIKGVVMCSRGGGDIGRNIMQMLTRSIAGAVLICLTVLYVLTVIDADGSGRGEQSLLQAAETQDGAAAASALHAGASPSSRQDGNGATALMLATRAGAAAMVD